MADGWVLLGTANQFLGEYEKARRNFEAAIRLLKDDPKEARRYAAALDNLGSLEMEEGQIAASKRLRVKAKALFEAAGDHVGSARVTSNLALIALGGGHYKDAQELLIEAFHDVEKLPEPDADDLAAMYGTQSVIDWHERDLPGALAAIQHAIELYEKRRGPEYFLLGGAYLIRGETYERLGDYQKAESDVQKALAHFEKTPGKNSPLYLGAEIAYAHMLRHRGMKKEAAVLEERAKTSLQELYRQQCVGCGVSASSFQ
jgi:tetratricopeptide (TPR) repeat protein